MLNSTSSGCQCPRVTMSRHQLEILHVRARSLECRCIAPATRAVDDSTPSSEADGVLPDWTERQVWSRPTSCLFSASRAASAAMRSPSSACRAASSCAFSCAQSDAHLSAEDCNAVRERSKMAVFPREPLPAIALQ